MHFRERKQMCVHLFRWLHWLQLKPGSHLHNFYCRVRCNLCTLDQRFQRAPRAQKAVRRTSSSAFARSSCGRLFGLWVLFGTGYNLCWIQRDLSLDKLVGQALRWSLCLQRNCIVAAAKCCRYGLAFKVNRKNEVNNPWKWLCWERLEPF